MVLKDEVHFWGWKGEFVSAGSCECGTVVELDNAICLFEDWKKEERGCTIMGPVTRWRMYPRSKEFSSHVHIIFDDRMDIVVLNDNYANECFTSIKNAVNNKSISESQLKTSYNRIISFKKKFNIKT